MPKTSRETVYEALEEEQKARKDIPRLGSIPNYIKYLEILLGFAKERLGWSEPATLIEIKNIAAGAIECMEEYGAPKRSEQAPIRMRSPRMPRKK